MKQIVRALLCGAALTLVISGCELEGVTDSVTDTGYSWVNLNGLYRNPSGGAMVTGYTVTPGDAGSTNTVKGEILMYAGGGTTYSGTLNNKAIVPGTVVISAATYVFNDNGDGTLSGLFPTSGTIEYKTGAWSIDLGGLIIAGGTPIVASYQHMVGGTAGKVSPGSSKTTIYSMVVNQSGNQISLTDSDGYVYTGKLYSVTSTTGKGQPETAGQVIAPFRVVGVSKGKMLVTIEGTFTATYLTTAAQTTTTSGGAVGQSAGRPTMYMLTDRRVDGTWVETSTTQGKIVQTGNVVGTTASLNVTVQGTATTTLSI